MSDFTPRSPKLYPSRICAYCKQTFQGTASRKFCSQKCQKANTAAVYVSTGQWRIFERDFFRCIYCGRSSIEDGVKLTADHVHPRSHGGADIAENLITACTKCNLSKHQRRLRPSTMRRLLNVIQQRNAIVGLTPDAKIKLSVHYNLAGSYDDKRKALNELIEGRGVDL